MAATVQTVADLLRESAASDSRKPALVVQGGGMRGVYSMGALAALEDAGLRDAFKLVVGSSAGAINGAYLLAGQANEAVNVYVEYLSNKSFVNLRRINKIVDIDYLVDVALKVKEPLDVDAVKRASALLEVVLTDSETAEPVIVTNRTPDVDFYEVIRATAALPSLYNRKVRVGDHTYIDGGFVDGVPVMRAVDSGATEVLAVLTRSPGFRRLEQNIAFRTLGKAMARGQSAAVKALIGRADVRFNDAMDFLEGKAEAAKTIRHWCVWPSDLEKLVGRTTFDKERLRDCAEMGRADMRRVLEGSA